ncbi:hypothetical protein IKP85_07075 [bacterium]|nr:hypothetical protein [bacterium]
MKCPICKKTIPDKSLRCPHCKTRTGLICKNCHTVNTIFDVACKKCGEEILRLCPECSCVNFPNAAVCRKCGHQFPVAQKMRRISPAKTLAHASNQKNLSQTEAENLLEEALLDDTKKIISLSGVRGIGKSHVLSKVIQKMQDKPIVWFYGKCTPITQFTAGGLIQDIIFNLYNLPNFCLNNEKFTKDAIKLFRTKFPYLTNEEIGDFLNFLYPSNFGMFEEISERKTKTFNMLNKIFDNIIMYSKYVIIADNFDSVDGLSYEFLNSYIKKDSVYKDLKLLLIYSNDRPSKGYFNFDNPDIYYDMRIVPLDRHGMVEFLNKKEAKQPDFPAITEAERELIFAQSKGNCSYIEQACGLRLDSQISDTPFDLPESYEDVVAKRICLLSAINHDAYLFITAAALLGDKINLSLIKQIFAYDDVTFDGIITYLKNMNFIAPLNEIFCQFKDLLLWETILSIAKNDEQYVDLNTHVCNSLAQFTPNSNAIFARIAQNIKNPKLGLDIWTRSTRLAAYIGDKSLYAISQKQCMALINELDDNVTLNIRYNISERLGKLLTDYNPSEAMDYLPDAIANAKNQEDIPKEIELLGYMSKCCSDTGNYLGNVECVDNALEEIPPEKKLEITLIKCSKLKSLLAVGNCGQIVNMVDNDIVPVFEEVLSKPYTRKDIPFNVVTETYIKTKLILAEALAMQGDSRSFEVLTKIFEMTEKNNVEIPDFMYQCKLTLAFANTMKGDFETSDKLLEEIMKLHEQEKMKDKSIVKWNSINIINNFMRHKYKDMQDDLFHVVTYANNCGDNFTKNIMKSLLGKAFKDTDKVENATDIYNEQIAYFSKEKMAIGALLTWYLIAETKLDTDAYEASEIASKALEVAQSPKIDNHFFEILLKTVLAKSAISTSDYTTAKIHITEAVKVAKQYGMNDQLSRLYLLYGKYFQELGLAQSDEQKEYIEGAKKMYEFAENLVKQTKNSHIHIELEQAKGVLKSFATVNGIAL